MRRIQYTCQCSRVGEFDVLFNAKRLVEESIEWASAPSVDEWSDMMINVSCLLHSIFNWWVWIVPGGGKSQDKGLTRYALHGCCRSKRNSCKNTGVS